MRMVAVRNATQGVELARAEWRGSFLGRARGLLGRAALPAGEGIVIEPCDSVHMFFMRFPIDVVYVDREGTVLKAVAGLRPYRLSVGGRCAHTAVELPAGTLARTGTRTGDQLTFEEETPAGITARRCD